jgi:hypothetical protein
MTARHKAEEKAVLGDQKSMSQEDREAAAHALYDKHEPERKAFAAENDKHQSEGHNKGYFSTTNDESGRVGKDDRAADKFHIWASPLKDRAVPEHYKSDTAMKKIFGSAPQDARKTLTVKHKGTGETQSFKVIQIHGHLLMQGEGGKLSWTSMDELKAHLKSKAPEKAVT